MDLRVCERADEIIQLFLFTCMLRNDLPCIWLLSHGDHTINTTFEPYVEKRSTLERPYLNEVELVCAYHRRNGRHWTIKIDLDIDMGNLIVLISQP